MKIAILSESDADRAAVHILVNALAGQSTVLYDRSFRTRGWSTVVSSLSAVIKELHFTTDVDALVVVLDSDKTPPHLPEHDNPGKEIADCRFCQVRDTIVRTRDQLKDINRRPLRIAVGLAVPCIEAWLRCGLDPHVTEADWLIALNEKRFRYDGKSLKRDVYGTDRPTIGLETRRMQEEALRLASEIDQLSAWFKNGFGPFAAEIRSWQIP